MNSYYIINLLIYAAVDATACLGLNQQFGVAGITNFGFIIFQAAGGYTAAKPDDWGLYSPCSGCGISDRPASPFSSGR